MNPNSRALRHAALVVQALALALLLGACGGSDAPDTPSERSIKPLASTDTVMSPGTLRSVTALGTVSIPAIVLAMAQSRVPAIVPVYEVQTFRLVYTTTDGKGQPILASGLLAVPKKAPGAASPVISYQHATIFRDAEAPSNNPSGTEPAVVMASLGYVVVAADYVGYGVSRGAPHPYLLAAPTAAAVIDLMDAAGALVGAGGLVLNGQLFMVGYSEGGYATMAAHRALQARGGGLAEALVGSAPGSAPLDVGATLDELLRRVRNESAFLAFFVDPDLLQNLGSSLRARVRDAMLDKLLPGDSDVVFQSTFIDNFLANDRRAINRDSDVHDWRPTAHVRLFHGRDDQTVPFIASASAVQAMLARGAPDIQWLECSTVPSGHLECVAQYWQFILSQMGLVVRDL
jgi:hypothetical protein